MANKKKANILLGAGLGCLIFIIVFSVMCGMINFNRYITYNYELSAQSDQYFERAFATNNIEEFANLSEKALAYYDGFTDNPDWWFPTIKTDWHVIIDDARIIIETSRIASNNSEIGSDAYEEALLSAQSSMNTTQGRLTHNISLELSHPKYWGTVHQWWLWLIVSWIVFIVLMIWQYDVRNYW